MHDLIWMGSARQIILRFPAVARKLTGYELYLIQQGMEPTDWKPMPDIGMGVKELRVQAIGQFRIIYIAAFEEGIYVLHAFQKKTRKTSKKDIDLAKLRLRDVMKQRIKK